MSEFKQVRQVKGNYIIIFRFNNYILLNNFLFNLKKENKERQDVFPKDYYKNEVMTDEEERATTSTTDALERRIKPCSLYYRWDNLIYMNIQFNIDGN